MAQATAAFRLPTSGTTRIAHQVIAGSDRGPGIRVSVLSPAVGSPRAVFHPTSTETVGAAMVHDAVMAVRAGGFLGSITTPALSFDEVASFEAAGFTKTTELALLRRDLHPHVAPVGALKRVSKRTARGEHGLRITSGPSSWRRSRNEWIAAALRVDQLAFPAGEQFDELSIREALEATPQVSIRFACRSLEPLSIVGYAISGSAGSRGYLQRLAVDPSFSGSGIGTALCQDSIEWCRSHGARVLAVNTRFDNDRAFNLYVRLGFEPIEGGLVVMGLPAVGPPSP